MKNMHATSDYCQCTTQQECVPCKISVLRHKKQKVMFLKVSEEPSPTANHHEECSRCSLLSRIQGYFVYAAISFTDLQLNKPLIFLC